MTTDRFAVLCSRGWVPVCDPEPPFAPRRAVVHRRRSV